MAQACMRMEISSSSSTLRTNADMLEDDIILEETTHHSTPLKNFQENFVDTLTTISESQESLCSTGIPSRKIPKLNPSSEVDEPDFANSFDICVDPSTVRSSLPANFVAPQLMDIESDSNSNQDPDTYEQGPQTDSNIPAPSHNSTPGKKCNKGFFKAPLTRRLSFAFSRSSFSRKSDACASSRTHDHVTPMSCDDTPVIPVAPSSTLQSKSCGTQPATTEEQPVTTLVLLTLCLMSVEMTIPFLWCSCTNAFRPAEWKH